MTLALSGEKIAKQIEKEFPGCIAEATSESLLVKAESLSEVAAYLKDTPGLDFDYLSSVTAVDYFDCFEVVYNLTSIKNNHSLVLKTRCYDRDNPEMTTVYACIVMDEGDEVGTEPEPESEPEPEPEPEMKVMALPVALPREPTDTFSRHDEEMRTFRMASFLLVRRGKV